jgi:hypothetical protein
VAPSTFTVIGWPVDGSADSITTGRPVIADIPRASIAHMAKTAALSASRTQWRVGRARERVRSSDISGLIDAQEIVAPKLRQHLCHIERRSVLSEACHIRWQPGAHERSQNGLVHCTEAAFGGRDTAPAGTPKRIQSRRL